MDSLRGRKRWARRLCVHEDSGRKMYLPKKQCFIRQEHSIHNILDPVHPSTARFLPQLSLFQLAYSCLEQSFFQQSFASAGRSR